MTIRGYVRVSLDTEVSGSIDKQRGQLNDYRAVDEWYEDRSVSGSKVPMGERDDGARLLRDVEAGDVVLVTKIDRAARNVTDLLHVVRHINAQGASIRFTEQNIDTSGAMGELVLTILGAIAQFEAHLIGERRRESLVAFRQEGRHATGAAPFGLVSMDNSNGRGLVIRPDETVYPPFVLSPAEQARRAVARVLQGDPQERVRGSLVGYGTAGMSKTGFSKLLRNPRLAGMVPHGEDVVRHDDGSPRIDPEAALVSMATWDALQTYLSKADKSWSRRGGYGASLRCSGCGGRLYYQSSTKKPEYSTYRCIPANHKKGDADGPTVSVMVHAADAHLEERFLAECGGSPYKIARRVSESVKRLEAISAAKVRLDHAQRLLTAAEGDEEEDRAFGEVRAAKRALRAAEAMPAESRTVVEDTGFTLADLWTLAEVEPDTDRIRNHLLRSAGSWTVLPGRGSVEDRIVFDPDGAELVQESAPDLSGMLT